VWFYVILKRRKIRFMKNEIKPMQERKNFQMVLETNEMRIENDTMMNKQVILITDKSSLNVLTVEMKHIKGLKLAFPAFVC
jgi:hypothetical protein